MTGVKEIFQNLDETVKLPVYLGDNKQVQAEVKGTILIRDKSGNEKFIHDVLYIRGLAHNLISVGQLVERGYFVSFHHDKCIISKENSDVPVMEVCMTASRMFPFRIFSIDLAMVANVKNDPWLWHRRYGHLNFNGLKLLHEKKMVVGLPSIEQVEEVCEGCIYGKHQRGIIS